MSIRLGVNVDHVATLRQARKGHEPSVLDAAREAIKGGADLITMHLREDRRHIQDADVFAFKKKFKTPLNFEMAVIPAMIRIALKLKPASVCLVPEKREELTTEGGLDITQKYDLLKKIVPQLQAAGIEVFPFIDPDLKQITLCKKLGCEGIEIHTGNYAAAGGWAKPTSGAPEGGAYSFRVQLERIKRAAQSAHSLGLEVHAGHGLTLQNLKPLLKIKEIVEFNIGHSIVSRAVFIGLKRAVSEVKNII